MLRSLVGSEMCIRDRIICPSTRPVTLGRLSIFGDLAPAAARAVMRAPEPVSYTHLTLPTIYSV